MEEDGVSVTSIVVVARERRGRFGFNRETVRLFFLYF